MKNVILIGMPGTGKSVVGRALAERLGYTVIDADDVIVKTTGKTLPEILRTDGLDAFLEIEAGVGETMDYEDTVFYEILAEELARRDLGLEDSDPEDFSELTARMDEYLAEFEKNGLNTINIDI